MVAAWISAETGVGPAIASGSQTYSGSCAVLPVAPKKKQQPDRNDSGSAHTRFASSASASGVAVGRMSWLRARGTTSVGRRAWRARWSRSANADREPPRARIAVAAGSDCR